MRQQITEDLKIKPGSFFLLNKHHSAGRISVCPASLRWAGGAFQLTGYWYTMVGWIDPVQSTQSGIQPESNDNPTQTESNAILIQSIPDTAAGAAKVDVRSFVMALF